MGDLNMLERLSVLFAGALLMLAGTTACVDVEYGLVLEDDLSGTAALDLDLDLERVAYLSARMQKTFSGEEGEPTEEEIQAAREEILESMEREEELSEEGLRDEIESDLPEGMELLDVELDEEGLDRHIRIRFAFDHVDRLSEVDVGPGEEGDGAPQAEPFGDLTVVDEGGTILITNAPMNPVAELQEQAQGGMPGMEGMLGEVFEGLRVAFSIEAPFEVAEHNATRVEGNTLWWEYDFAALDEMGDEMPDHIMVRYNK